MPPPIRRTELTFVSSVGKLFPKTIINTMDTNAKISVNATILLLKEMEEKYIDHLDDSSLDRIVDMANRIKRKSFLLRLNKTLDK